MVSQELVDLMRDLPDDGLVLLDRPTIDAARAGGVLAVLFQEEMKKCDWYSCGKPAAFDVHLAAGVWAPLCHEHYHLHGEPTLGPGKGQRLMLQEDEVFEDIEELKDIAFDGDVLDYL